MDRSLSRNTPLPDIQIFGEGLQFTGTISFAVQAIIGMIGKQQLHIGLSCPQYPGRMGHDLHGPFDGEGTGWNQILLSFNLNHTHPAGP
jgi:hypothetical protein